MEKAICRSFPPGSAHSIKVKVGGAKRSLAQVGSDDARKTGRSKQWRLLLDRFYIIGTSAGTQRTMIAKLLRPPSNIAELEANEKSPKPVSQPLHHRSSSAPLPRTPKLPAHEFFKQKNLPPKSPADEGSTLSTPPVPKPFHRRSLSTPVLGPAPQPRSSNTRRNMPLLIPPKDRASEKTVSRGSSMRSANIPIVYWPSNQCYDAEGENQVPLKASTSISRPRLLVSKASWSNAKFRDIR